jgi:hypothetical protein
LKAGKKKKELDWGMGLHFGPEEQKKKHIKMR